MSKKVNLQDIREIPVEDFEAIMKNWVNEKNVVRNLHAKMRLEIIQNFYNTRLGKKLEELQENRFHFDPTLLALCTMFAEFLYNQKFYFSLSVFMSEIKYKELPNFEKDDFRFSSHEIQEIMNLIGLNKSDRNNQKVVKHYMHSDKQESLIYSLLKQLIASQKPTAIANTGTQIDDIPETIPNTELSSSVMKKLKKRKTRKNHSLGKTDLLKKRSKQDRPTNEVNLIVENLVGMSNNISAISEKLDDFRKTSEPEIPNEKMEILTLVGNTCRNLNDCVTNFENLCESIKVAKATDEKTKNFDDWMNELETSENGKRFLKKLRKSYQSIIAEEKSRIKREYQKKINNEKYKLKKEKQKQNKSVDEIELKLKELDIKEKSIEMKLNSLDQKLMVPNNIINNPEDMETENVVTELKDFLKNTCKTLKDLEKENQLFDRSLEINLTKNDLNRKEKFQEDKLDIPKTTNPVKTKERKYQFQRFGGVKNTKVILVSTSGTTSSSDSSSSGSSPDND